jgi:hypothetical protein
VPEPSISEVEVPFGKLKRYKSPGADESPAELIQAGLETLCYEIHKLIKLIWNKEELPHQWKESVVIHIHKKGDKTECSSYWGISLLLASYKILSNILLSRLIPYADKIIGDHQCGFRCNRSTTDQIFYIRQILETKWEYNSIVYQLFINGTHQLLAYTDDVIILGENIDTIQGSREALLEAGKEVGLEVNSEKTKYMLMSHKKVGQRQWHKDSK